MFAIVLAACLLSDEMMFVVLDSSFNQSSPRMDATSLSSSSVPSLSLVASVLFSSLYVWLGE